MRNMTIDELYAYITSEAFLNTEGNIFYNYYIYQYPANQEYKMRKQILEFQESIRRPRSCVNAMVLDLFELFCDFLKLEKFGPQSYLESTLEDDKTIPDTVTTELTYKANTDDFIKYVSERIIDYIDQKRELKTPYVFINGIGKMFPYLRTNAFLTKYEKYNDTSKYKILLFYPGHQDGNSFSLFDTLEDSHTYRATLLVNK